jgi:hypothetical protein
LADDVTNIFPIQKILQPLIRLHRLFHVIWS